MLSYLSARTFVEFPITFGTQIESPFLYRPDIREKVLPPHHTGLHPSQEQSAVLDQSEPALDYS